MKTMIATFLFLLCSTIARAGNLRGDSSAVYKEETDELTGNNVMNRRRTQEKIPKTPKKTPREQSDVEDSEFGSVVGSELLGTGAVNTLVRDDPVNDQEQSGAGVVRKEETDEPKRVKKQSDGTLCKVGYQARTHGKCTDSSGGSYILDPVECLTASRVLGLTGDNGGMYKSIGRGGAYPGGWYGCGESTERLNGEPEMLKIYTDSTGNEDRRALCDDHFLCICKTRSCSD